MKRVTKQTRCEERSFFGIFLDISEKETGLALARGGHATWSSRR
jgi:hypothetical protein